MQNKKIGDLTDDEWNSQRCIAVDVDGTLIFWENDMTPGDPGGNFTPNWPLIERLIRWKATDLNRELIVWSGNHREHATLIVTKLKMLGVVDHVMSKPTFFLEDRPEWFDHTTTIIDVREQWPKGKRNE